MKITTQRMHTNIHLHTHLDILKSRVKILRSEGRVQSSVFKFYTESVAFFQNQNEIYTEVFQVSVKINR